MAIIVVSHQMGAGGPEIGMSVAQRLGYRYVNQELLLDAARRYGLAEDKLSHLDESKPTLFERFDTETRHHITVLQTTCLEFAEDDNNVLMRGGGQWLLRGVPHVLRVRIFASFEHHRVEPLSLAHGSLHHLDFVLLDLLDQRSCDREKLEIDLRLRARVEAGLLCRCGCGSQQLTVGVECPAANLDAP